MEREARGGAPACKVLEAVERRERVSEAVEGGEEERNVIRDSMAAMGGVRRGSVSRTEWYVWMMSKVEAVREEVSGGGVGGWVAGSFVSADIWGNLCCEMYLNLPS